MSMAAAPSVICDELPAVMSGAASSHPWADASDASFSSVVSRRMPSSTVSVSPVRVPSSSLTGTGRISRAKCPLSVAAAARRWLSRANSSMSSRVIFHLSASTCATWNCAHSFPSITCRKSWLNGPVPPLALDAIGARLIDSTPQAMATS